MLAHTDIKGADGHTLRLWKRESDEASEAVVLVHGATYGVRAMFAPSNGDREYWFDAVSEHGRVAFGVDVRGYGDSDRSPELDEPADDNRPVVRATEAARDVAVALEHVRSTFETVHLVGISWGTIISGVLLSRKSPPVDSLTLYAPIYELPDAVGERFDPGDPPAAYREVTKTEARERWNQQIPANVDPVEWRGGTGDSDPLFDALWEAAYGSGQAVSNATEPTIRIPNGTLLDLQAAVNGNPVYDPTNIDVPTMVIRGSCDPTSVRRDALDVFDAVSAEHSEYHEIDGGTHFLHLEPKRRVLYESVNAFHDRVAPQ